MKLLPAMIDRLENSELFNKLRRETEFPVRNYHDPADVLEIFEQFLFVWNCRGQSIHAVSLNHEKSSIHAVEYQTLALTSPPLGAVQQLLVSPAGQRLALVSPSGLVVAELPGRWGKQGLFEGGKRNIMCTSHQLEERFFLCNKHVQVSKVRWHPESPTDSHLVVLCSDNYLRVFDLAVSVQTPSHVIALGATHSASLSALPGAASFVRSLGEVAVSFAFAPQRPPPADQDQQEPLPVYILRGNGDIYITCIDLTSTSERFQVRGPVTMQPAADDNYGTDACDLLCVGGGPAVTLVVATPSRLYHCIVLAKPPDLADDEAGSEASWSRYSAGFSLEPAAVSLFVYESVEPELVLAPAQEDDAISSPVRLYPDPTSNCRYFCSHAAGVHAVAIPLIPALERYSAQEGGSDEPLGEHECIVEHLVSTRPLASSPECPVLGLVIIPHPLLMVVLLATYEVVVRPLLTRYRPPPEPADQHAPVGHTQESGDQFMSHVRRLLERTESVPVLRSAAETVPAAERLRLLTCAAGRLRHEYIRRQESAREALQTRCQTLNSLLQQQLKDIDSLNQQKHQLRRRAKQQAEMLSKLTEDRQRLAERAEEVYRRCQQGIPVLSDAEKAVVGELKNHCNISELQRQLETLKAKHEYQMRQESVRADSERWKDRQLAALSAAQRHLLSAELTAQGDQISGLVTQVQAGRKALGL